MEGLRSTGGVLISYLRQIIGTYTPLTDINGDPVITLAGVDWEYITQAIILIIALFYFFKAFMLIIKK